MHKHTTDHINRIRCALAGLMIVLASVIFPLKVLAESVDYNFYSSNDILFHDPNACDPSDGNNEGTGNSKVFALGDSLLEMAVSSGNLAKKLKNLDYTDFKYDAVIGRSITGGGETDSTAIDGASTNADNISAAGTILIILGTNSDNYNIKIPELMKIIRNNNKNARIFWVNVAKSVQIASMNEANKAISKYSAKYNYKIVDWHSIVFDGNQADMSLLDDEHDLPYHPSAPKGINALVSAITDAFGRFVPGGAAGDFDKFMQGLAMTESGGRYTVVNPWGYEGRYQIGRDFYDGFANSYPPARQYSPNAASAPGSVQDAMVYLNLYKRYLSYGKDKLKLAASWIWPAAATNPAEMDTDLGSANAHNTPRTYAQKVLKNAQSSAARKIKLNYRDAPDFERYYNNVDKNRNTPMGSFPGGSSSGGTGGTGGGGDTTSGGSSSDKPTIVIDPGHIPRSKFFKVDTKTGINDMDWDGAAGERVATFNIAKEVKKELENDGYKVILTKNSADQALSMRDRVEAANSANADLAISIHYDNGHAFGTWGQVYAQDTSLYRQKGKDGDGAKVYFKKNEVAQKSQTYAAAIEGARDKYEGDSVEITQLTDQTNRTTISGHTSAGGNIPLVMLWSDVPWVYNEAGGKNLSKEKYIKGLLEGIEKAVPPEGDSDSGSNDPCNPTGSDSGGIVAGDIVNTALNLAWPYHKEGSYGKGADGPGRAAAKPEYVEAKDKYNPMSVGSSAYTDCGVFVATVMRASGVDSNFQPRSSGAMDTYAAARPKKYKKVQSAGNPIAVSKLEPGDIFLNGGHAMLYVGSEGGPRWPIRQASHGSQTPNAQILWDQGAYNVYRILK